MTKSLLSTFDLDRGQVEEILAEAESFLAVLDRPIPVVPALRGTTVALLFFESSTRTRISFELAARRLSAEVINFSAGGSSIDKGESFRDTVETLKQMGSDALVVRHSSAGIPGRAAEWTGLPVISAGDGSHEHPTQALTDLFTIRRHLGDVTGVRVTIVGDIEHSRVARSDIWLLSKMGAEITLVAPPTLLPPGVEKWPVRIGRDLDSTLVETDVLMLLRIQRERGAGRRIPSLREFRERFGIDVRRAGLLPDGALVMHPGPMNKGLEIAPEVAELPGSLIGEQVSNGIAVRMAILHWILAGERPHTELREYELHE